MGGGWAVGTHLVRMRGNLKRRLSLLLHHPARGKTAPIDQRERGENHFDIRQFMKIVFACANVFCSLETFCTVQNNVKGLQKKSYRIKD